MKYYLLPYVLLFLTLSSLPLMGKGIVLKASRFDVVIDYNYLAVDLITDKKDTLQISAPKRLEYAIVEKQDENVAVIRYPELEKKMTFSIEGEDLKIFVESFANDKFSWPVLTKFDALTIPFYQGKYIPVNDSIWTNYLNGRTYSGLQDLSMQFVAPNYSTHAALFIITNKFNNELRFRKTKAGLSLIFEHEFPATVSKKEYGFVVKITDNSPTSIAKEYRRYILESTGITTLEEKANLNPNIRKLYGAAHFYIWSQEFLSVKNINCEGLVKFWAKQLVETGNNPTKHIFELFGAKKSEIGNEFLKQWEAIKIAGFVNNYYKSLIVRSLNEILALGGFYQPESWRGIHFDKPLKNNGTDIQQLSETDLYQLNKYAFYAAFMPYLETPDHWGEGVSLDVLNDMSRSGIKAAWMGLNEWSPAFIHPDFVSGANDLGYLISPYDDYHGIHEPGKERWTTAIFEGGDLYETATVTDKNGKKYPAFLGVGRKLNPIQAFPLVKKRVNGILAQGISFNSWFVDCDGTGEFLDDYTPGRMSSQEEDQNARLERLTWIGTEKRMVVGTEVGNDFCAPVIAFAHGMTTPVIEWGDEDMRGNRKSEYYVGDYFSPNGGVPSKFSKAVLLKPIYHYIYLNHQFNLPLFQLVYNNSVITSHHWEWGTLKIPALVKDREIQEILYNVPPLYHIDRTEWAKHKREIVNHVNEFREVHSKAVKMEMISFHVQSDNSEIQITQFGLNNITSIEIVANFSNEPYRWKEWTIPPKSLLISDLDTPGSHVYTP
jgi:hypothetical protein